MNQNSQWIVRGVIGVMLFVAVVTHPTQRANATDAEGRVLRAARSLTVPEAPVAYSASAEVIDPINNFYDVNSVEYDSLAQKLLARIAFHNPNETPIRVSILLLPQLGVSYRYSGPGACIQNPYTLPLNAFFNDSGPAPEFVGYENVLGRTLENWQREAELTTEQLVGRRSSKGYLLSSIDTRSKSNPTELATYTTYTHFVPYPKGHPDPSVFDIPADCPPLP